MTVPARLPVAPGSALPRSGSWAARVWSVARRRWRHPVGHREAGMSTVELVVLLPLVVFATLLPVQAALAWHAQQVLVAAAQEGARAARAADLPDGQAQQLGTAQARAFALQAGGRAVSTSSVQVTRNAEQVQVRVTGQALAVLPIFKIRVSGQAVSPVERFVGR